ncbi:AAA family ATPase, partial [Vibrio parahaemolyticus]|nr:AAA family ATPase [Vibrio parahaemolyticus]
MIQNRASVDALYDLTEKVAILPGQEPFKSKFGALWLHELASHTANVPWVVKRVIPAKGFGGIVGEPGSGKSFLALDVGFHVGVLARANPDTQWFGHRINHGGVIYIAAEGQSGFVKRIAALMGRYKIDSSANLPFVLLPTAVDLRSIEGDTDSLIEEIKAHGSRMDVPLSLIFVDTLNRVMAGGEENSSE